MTASDDVDTFAVRSGWDHEVGVHTVQAPVADSLLFASAAVPTAPRVYALTTDVPALIDSDRDRAVLRAFLTLALQRLDAQEENAR